MGGPSELLLWYKVRHVYLQLHPHLRSQPPWKRWKRSYGPVCGN